MFFSNKEKTLGQLAFESSSEYLNLGLKCQRPVKIFLSGDPSKSFSGYAINHDYSRSWINVSLKVASYCLVVFPVIALIFKAVMIFHWKLNLATEFQEENGRLEALAQHLLDLIKEYLDEASLKDLSRTCCGAYRTQLETERGHAKVMKPLKDKASLMERDQTNALMLDLVGSPSIGNKTHWVPVMDKVISAVVSEEMNRSLLFCSNNSKILSAHERINRLLIFLKKKKNMIPFLVYLKRSLPLSYDPYFGYIILQKYQRLVLGVDKARGELVIEDYLTQKAQDILNENGVIEAFAKNPCFFGITIGSRIWFGKRKHFWSNAINPDLIKKVLIERILDVKKIYKHSYYSLCRCRFCIGFSFWLSRSILKRINQK